MCVELLLCACVRACVRACVHVCHNCSPGPHDGPFVNVCRDNASSHFGPVWQVGWVEKERSTAEDRTEVLVSVGADGRVIQWSIRKGFEGTQLMRIKRPTHLAGEGRVMGGVGGGAEKKGAGSKVKQSVAPAQQDVGVGSEALISQYSVGLGFDFWERDSNM